MWQLNLPTYQFNIKKKNTKYYVMDNQRKRWVILTPEEWVRQHLIQYLIREKYFPAARIAVEKQILVNELKKRCDAIVYDQSSSPLLIVECKAPHVPITQNTFDQAAVYNQVLNAPFLLVSNGLEHQFCRVDIVNRRYTFLSGIPLYSELKDIE